MQNANTTKDALGESLKKLIQTKRLEKITIRDLTADCNVSRAAFYYHFKDIYDLVEWVCVEDGRRALQNKKTYDTWQEGVSQVFDAVLENRAFILRVYRSVGRERVESFLFKVTYDLIREVVEEKCRGRELTAKHKNFITDFYKYGLVGTMLNWMEHGMKEDYEEIVEYMGVMLHGNIDHSIGNFEKKEEGGM